MADFNLRAYIQNNGDLMQTFGEDFAAYCEHYITSGRAEGRTALPGEGSDPGLGSYSSTYDVTQQRAVNVELAVQRINGVVLQPGEEGGGICQVSSTLYVAMIRAGLPSTERWTHSAPVDYVPQGLDATIAEGTKDLKFVNVYAKPLVINATTQDGVLTVTLQFEETAS